MELYILRHAIAVKRGSKEYPNDDRPLTNDGIQKMKSAAGGIRNIVGDVNVILTSPLIRARDTAKIVAKALKYKREILTCEELLPGKPIAGLMTYLAKFKTNAKVVLIGHEPDLGLAASAFLGCDQPVIQFKKGGLCRIDVPAIPLKEPGTLIWHLTPNHLRMIAEG